MKRALLGLDTSRNRDMSPAYISTEYVRLKAFAVFLQAAALLAVATLSSKARDLIVSSSYDVRMCWFVPYCAYQCLQHFPQHLDWAQFSA
jgi:hypothetical protein